MKVKTSFNKFKKLSQSGFSVVEGVIQSILVDFIEIYQRLSNRFSEGVMIEFSEKFPNHVLMGFNPRGILKIKNGEYEAVLEGEPYAFESNPLDALRQFHKISQVKIENRYPSLMGGIIGFMNYESIKYFEMKLKREAFVSDEFDILFKSYAINLSFNKKTQEIHVALVVNGSNHLETDYQNAIKFLEEIFEISLTPLSIANLPDSQFIPEISCDINDFQYQAMVRKAKSYIQKGDAFQIVPSRTFSCTYHTSPLNIYRSLRKTTPAPYLFYNDNGDSIIIGASPEKLVSVQGNQVETVPIAGTSKSTSSNAISDLLKDEKQLAEHMMLVDLSRNDLGKVCLPGTVQVKSLLKPKKAGHLNHLTSLVSGEISKSFDSFDALKAVFPAGTLSGAPKLRAMEIINEIENTSRGFYGGAFCFIDQGGDLDSAIVIRTMVLKNGIAKVRAGAGVVFDSVPEKEAEESYDKASTVLNAIKMAEEAICF